MNALADKAHKQGMPNSDMHSITPGHIIQQPLHKYSNKFSADWRATATLVSRSQTLSSFIGKGLVDYNIPIWFSRQPLWLAVD